AVDLEPLSSETNTWLGIGLFYARRYAEAGEQLKKTIELEPSYWYAHLFLGRSYQQQGDLTAAIAEFREASRLEDVNPESVAALGRAYALTGDRNDAQKVIAELEARSRQSNVPSYNLAVIHAALGEKDRALELIEKAYEEHSFYTSVLKVDPE